MHFRSLFHCTRYNCACVEPLLSSPLGVKGTHTHRRHDWDCICLCELYFHWKWNTKITKMKYTEKNIEKEVWVWRRVWERNYHIKCIVYFFFGSVHLLLCVGIRGRHESYHLDLTIILLMWYTIFQISVIIISVIKQISGKWSNCEQKR